jgi:hypothetical protein
MSKCTLGLVLLSSVIVVMFLGATTLMPVQTKADTSVEPVSVEKPLPMLKAFSAAATLQSRARKINLLR